MKSSIWVLVFSGIALCSQLSPSTAAEGTASVAKSYRLGEILTTALDHSPEVLRSESSATSASWRKTEAYSGFLPTISASGTYLFDKKYAFTDLVFGGNPTSVPQIIPTSNFLLNAQLPLFDGWSSTRRLLAARSFQRGAEDDRDWTRFRTERQVTLQFYQALGAKLLRDVAIQNVKTIEDHLKDSRLFKKTGLSTNYDVLRVEVQTSEARSELLNAEDNVAAERNRLARIIGMESGIEEVDGTLPVLPDDLLKGFKADSLESRADLRAQNEKETAYHQSEAAASTYWVPKLSLFGQYQYYNNLNDRFTDWDRYRTAYQYGIMATWNLFDGLASFSRSKQSVEDRKQAEITTHQARLQAKEDLDFWRRKFGYFTTVYHSRVDDIEKATESVRLAREGRKVGARTNTDLLDAEVELFRARANAVKAQLGAIEAAIRLELASGQSLYRFR